MSQGTRLNKFLSEIGYCSRREADKLIENGSITVNGKKAAIGAIINPEDKIKVNGNLLDSVPENHVYIAFNKPVGIVTTTDTQNERDNIIDFIQHEKRIFPIGRLDKLSEGLIFLTSDGDIVNKILRAGNKHEKEYVVSVNHPISKEFIDKMSNGIPILGATTKKCFVEQTKTSEFRIILTQGMNRQIRRMCEYLGFEVTKLKRTRIMNIKLDLIEGQWRDLKAEEIQEIKLMVESSSSETKKSSNAKPKSKVTSTKTSNANSSSRNKSKAPGNKSSSNYKGKTTVKPKKPSNRAAAAKKNRGK
jgi:23S rRNA pseudouridine2604 synthase